MLPNERKKTWSLPTLKNINSLSSLPFLQTKFSSYLTSFLCARYSKKGKRENLDQTTERNKFSLVPGPRISNSVWGMLIR